MSTKERLNKVEKTLFIKLGQGGEFEEECIRKNILKIGYNDVDHDLCLQNGWQQMRDYFINERHVQRGAATRHANQLKDFYQADENVLWITFCNNKLYWCFSKNKIFIQKDKTKIRKVIGKWSCNDLKGEIIRIDNINGRLAMVQNFQGAICLVHEKNYLIKKIKGEKLAEIIEAEKSFGKLKDILISLIKELNYKDFELLVDLIFRGGGWQRVGVVGKTQKSIDLSIFHPITGESAIVQIKCQTNLAEFNEYKKIFRRMTHYNRFFYVVHTPQGSLKKYINDMDHLNLYFSDKIAELAINAGLTDWILKKVG